MKIPFGKHKGRMLVEVMAEDPQYVDWMMQQAWFAEKFKPLYELAKAGLGSGAENTPEHNAMQARFLDPAYCAALAIALKPGVRGLYNARFEDITDVRFRATWGDGIRELWVELKPSLGDDYPAVIRQVKAQQQRAEKTRGAFHSPPVWIVLAGQFSAQGVTLDLARAMFSQSGLWLVLAADVDAQLEDARRWVEAARQQAATDAGKGAA
jgi:hypothetical protein